MLFENIVIKGKPISQYETPGHILPPHAALAPCFFSNASMKNRW